MIYSGYDWSSSRSDTSHKRITVSDPAKCSDKYGQLFISYKVSSPTSTASGSSSVTVVRRYNDFTWFHSVLSAQYPGVIMPPLPDKQTVGRFSSEFVESRRRSLEKYLERISKHPELSTSEHYFTFLQTDDASLARLKEDFKSSKPALSTTAAKWIETKVQSISAGGKEIEKSAADVKIVEILQYVNSLEKQMANVTKYSEQLIKRNREISQAMFEFGQSFSWLGQGEGDIVGEGLTQLGGAAESLSVITSAHAEEQVIKLLEPFEEYSRMLSSIKVAIQQRQDIKNAYIHSINDVDVKTNAWKKLLNAPGKDTQAASKEQAMKAAIEAMEIAKNEYEKVTERLLLEYESFKSRKVADIKEIILNFVTLQIEFHKKSEDAWTELLPKIEGITIPDSLPQGVRPVAYTSLLSPSAQDSQPEQVRNPRTPQSTGNPFGDDHLAEEEEGEEGGEGYDGLGQEGPTVRDSSRRGGRDIYSYRIDQGRLDEEDNDDEDEDGSNQNEISGV